jgi:hypothetical protein
VEHNYNNCKGGVFMLEDKIAVLKEESDADVEFFDLARIIAHCGTKYCE